MQKNVHFASGVLCNFFHASETNETMNLCFVWWESVPIVKMILPNRLEENAKTM